MYHFVLLYNYIRLTSIVHVLPPTLSLASKTVTSIPFSIKNLAAVSPISNISKIHYFYDYNMMYCDVHKFSLYMFKHAKCPSYFRNHYHW